MSETSIGVFGSIVLVSSQESPEHLLMYEFVMPFLSKESVSLVSSLTSENARMPLMMIFMGITAFYQMYWKEGAPFNPDTKRNKENEKNGGKGGDSESSGLMKGFREHAQKHGKLTPQMEQDMEEIDAMMSNMN